MVVLKCKICNKSFRVKPYKKNLSKYCSYKCRDLDYRNRFKGKNNPFYNKKHSDETRIKLSKSLEGLLAGKKHPFWGKHRSEKTKKNISESVKKFITENPDKIGFQKGHKINLGRRYSLERNTKIRLSRLGKERPPFTSKWLKNMSEATYQKHRKMNFGFQRGKRNPSWNDGSSYKTHGYGSGWTGYLKTKIRERDEFICQLCGDYKNLAIHHIDYKKQNCNENNLITLCKSCNIKINFNRKKWGKLLKKKIQEGFLLTR